MLTGSFKHEVYGRRIERYLKEKGCRCWFERGLGTKRFDLVFQEQDASMGAVEICLTGSAKWNVEQALRGIQNEGIKTLIVACETKEMCRSVEKEFGNIDSLGLYKKKIQIRHLGEFL